MTQGLGRFAYALILPAMRDDLGWTYTMAGGMNTANAVGYLLGALSAAPAMGRLGARRAFTLGVLATAAALVLSGFTADYLLLLLLRVVIGLSGAIGFVAGGSLVAHGATAGERASTALGIYYGGPGLGILFSGAALPMLLEAGNGSAWRVAWIVLGVAALAACALATVGARRFGEPPVRAANSTLPAMPRALWPAFTGYFLFGMGYVAYMTFVIAYLRTQGAGAPAIALFWSVLGLSIFATAPVGGRLLERLRGGQGLAATIGIVWAGASVPLLSAAPAAMLLSGALFGACFMTTVTATTVLVRRSLLPYAWSGGIAAFTVVFAVGQCLGPLLSGAISDGPGGLHAGLLASSAVLAAGALIALLQSDRRVGGEA